MNCMREKEREKRRGEERRGGEREREGGREREMLVFFIKSERRTDK